MSITMDDIKKLREITGAGIMDCKGALAETGNDIDAAVEYLRKKGLAALKKRAEREAREGLVESYIHHGGRIGVLIEVNCETDFVARNESFKNFVHDLSMQVAAANPTYVSRADIPADEIEKEKALYREQLQTEGKPDHVIEKIMTGKMDKYFEQVCLLDQRFIRNPDITIEDYLGEVAAKLGENIVIRRFVRYVLGEAE